MLSETIIRNAKQYEDDLRSLSLNHLTLYQIARELKLSPATVRRYMQHLGIRLPRQRKQRVNAEDTRVPAMILMRKEGNTLDEIGNQFGLTRERVRQLLARDCPDTVFPKRDAPQGSCLYCGGEYALVGIRSRFCSSTCKKANRDNAFTRDKAILIMRYRDMGKTWVEVGHTMKHTGSEGSFRANLQRSKHFFSSEEQNKYFPAFAEERFKPSDVKLLPRCSQTTKDQDSLIIRKLRRLFSLILP